VITINYRKCITLKKNGIMEISFIVSDGTHVRGCSYEPDGDCIGVIILVHGLGEHFGRYSGWASRFVTSGYSVFGADLPGHGLSSGRRGHISSYAITEEIIDGLLSAAGERFPGVPLVLYGHSLGGGIVLRYLIRRQPVICCAIVTSPWLRLSFDPPKIKLWLAMAVKRVAPSMVQPSGLIVNYISRDSDVVSEYLADPLVHDRISVSLFNGAMTAASYSLSNASLLTVPLLLMHGTGDLITSPEGSRRFSEVAPGTELKLWDGGYHELHNDIIKEEVYGFISGWLAASNC
jgi:alpha-beta hydrolase superfamily lysophospholipase